MPVAPSAISKVTSSKSAEPVPGHVLPVNAAHDILIYMSVLGLPSKSASSALSASAFGSINKFVGRTSLISAIESTVLSKCSCIPKPVTLASAL